MIKILSFQISQSENFQLQYKNTNSSKLSYFKSKYYMYN